MKTIHEFQRNGRGFTVRMLAADPAGGCTLVVYDGEQPTSCRIGLDGDVTDAMAGGDLLGIDPVKEAIVHLEDCAEQNC